LTLAGFPDPGVGPRSGRDLADFAITHSGLLFLVLETVDGDEVVEDHQQEKGHAHDVGEDSQLNVSDHDD